MAETAFYVLGGAVIALAIVVAAIGLRWETFPGSRAAVVGLAVLFAGLVVATGSFAWIHAADEQHEHAAEEAEKRAEAAGERAAELRERVQPAAAEGEAADADGEQVFASQGCASCHTLEAAGASGDLGPNLDEALPDRQREEVERLIVDPGSEVSPGFEAQAGLMPDNYGDALSPEELDALVEFLIQSTR